MPITTREIVVRLEVSIDSDRVAVDAVTLIRDLINGMKEELRKEDPHMLTDGAVRVQAREFEVYDPSRGKPPSMAGRRVKLGSY